jgi:DNA polymerase-3 subunit epsilon
VAARLRDTAEVVMPGPGPVPAASAEETECVLRWLEAPGVRLIRLEGTWACPTFGAGGVRLWAEAADEARDALGGGLTDRRDIAPVHRPGALVTRMA